MFSLPNEICFNVVFFQSCYNSSCERIVKKLLEFNGKDNAEVYLIASNWALTERKNVDEARSFIIKGLCTHLNNKMLLKHYFEAELVGAVLRQEYCQGNNCAHVLN